MHFTYRHHLFTRHNITMQDDLTRHSSIDPLVTVYWMSVLFNKGSSTVLGLQAL